MSNSAAAIWDVDGTLVDTADLHFQAWQRIAAELRKPFTRDDFQATFGRRNAEIIRAVFDSSASDADVARIGDRKETCYRDATRNVGVQLLPGVAELLARLRADGWLQAVGSSAPRANLELLLEATGSQSYFQSIVAAEDTVRGKPDPQVFQIAADRLGVLPDQCVVLEDAIAGVHAAKAAGMACVAVTFVGHHSVESMTAARADLVVATLEDVTVEAMRRLLEAPSR